MFTKLYDNIISRKKYNPYALEKKLRKSSNLHIDFNYLGFGLNWIQATQFLNWLYMNHQFKDIYRENHNSAVRHKRIQDKIYDIVTNDDFSYLITFTFNNHAFDLKEDTRRQYVIRFLKKYCNKYVANIDYGKKKGREHYHAVGSIYCDLDQCIWKYGFIDIVPIRSASDDSRIAHYLNKLTNHALKDHGKRKHIIYSR